MGGSKKNSQWQSGLYPKSTNMARYNVWNKNPEKARYSTPLGHDLQCHPTHHWSSFPVYLLHGKNRAKQNKVWQIKKENKYHDLSWMYPSNWSWWKHYRSVGHRALLNGSPIQNGEQHSALLSRYPSPYHPCFFPVLGLWQGKMRGC